MDKQDCVVYIGEFYTIEWYFDCTGYSQAYEYFLKTSDSQKRKFFILIKRMAEFGKISDITPLKKRGAEAFDDMGILPDFKGVSVHDFWKPYEKYHCSHAYCNAHLIRKLTFVFETMEQKWAGKMIRLMLKMKEAVDESEKGCLAGDIPIRRTCLQRIQENRDVLKKARF